VHGGAVGVQGLNTPIDLVVTVARRVAVRIGNGNQVQVIVVGIARLGVQPTIC
jgi:hypothetical protein